VRQVRCPFLALPPDRTRCSPGLRSPSGFSPLALPAGGMPDQDPLVPGRDHRWCARAWRTWLEFSVTWAGFLFSNTKSDCSDPVTAFIFPTDTVAATFRGLFSCTLLCANAQEDTQAGPPKTIRCDWWRYSCILGFRAGIVSADATDFRCPVTMPGRRWPKRRSCPRVSDDFRTSTGERRGRRGRNTEVLRLSSCDLCLRSESAHITSFPANVANPR